MSVKPASPTPSVLLEAKRAPDLVTVPSRLVIARTGAGSPDGPSFRSAVEALYGIAYTMRFARKKSGLPVFKVGTLEGEWWAEGDDLPTDRVPDREDWRWQVRIAMPDDATEEELAGVIDGATSKRGGKLEGSDEARAVELVRLPERPYARILHDGPYAEEPVTFEVLDDFLEREGRRRVKRHVEVYLSDPSRTAPERLRTVLLTELVGG